LSSARFVNWNVLPTGFQLCEENNMMLERILLIGVLFAACLSAHAADRKFIVKPRPQGFAALPFSDGVLVGKTLYIAGIIGLDAKTGQPPAAARKTRPAW
jgi:enamine deaminase RidA (YjgF/YER057c/UK114 family)